MKNSRKLSSCLSSLPPFILRAFAYRFWVVSRYGKLPRTMFSIPHVQRINTFLYDGKVDVSFPLGTEGTGRNNIFCSGLLAKLLIFHWRFHILLGQFILLHFTFLSVLSENISVRNSFLQRRRCWESNLKTLPDENVSPFLSLFCHFNLALHFLFIHIIHPREILIWRAICRIWIDVFQKSLKNSFLISYKICLPLLRSIMKLFSRLSNSLCNIPEARTIRSFDHLSIRITYKAF